MFFYYSISRTYEKLYRRLKKRKWKFVVTRELRVENENISFTHYQLTILNSHFSLHPFIALPQKRQCHKRKTI